MHERNAILQLCNERTPKQNLIIQLSNEYSINYNTLIY